MSDKKKKLPISKTQYKKLVNECLTLISDYKLLFISDLIALLPFSKSTFYVYGLDKSDAVKEAIENNRSMIKQKLRAKWYESSTPTLQIALYKILATPEERKAMSSSSKDAKNDGMFPLEVQKAYLASLEKMADDCDDEENEDNGD
ncbi:MAG: hypothetical protein K6C94_06975 [Candidatus Gastranaerophilales bacterium]|nr:hypothetical protein [Candidatus Gastranaerophilales bacterium]